jgi:hypothetical protein
VEDKKMSQERFMGARIWRGIKWMTSLETGAEDGQEIVNPLSIAQMVELPQSEQDELEVKIEAHLQEIERELCTLFPGELYQ